MSELKEIEMKSDDCSRIRPISKAVCELLSVEHFFRVDDPEQRRDECRLSIDMKNQIVLLLTRLQKECQEEIERMKKCFQTVEKMLDAAEKEISERKTK